MSNHNTGKPATAEDVRRAFAELVAALTPVERQQLQRDKRFVSAVQDQRRAALLAHIDSPEALERRQMMTTFIERSR